MKTLKIMSIVALVWFSISWICLAAYNNSYDYESAIGWGFLAVMYGIAFAVVALVKSVKK